MSDDDDSDEDDDYGSDLEGMSEDDSDEDLEEEPTVRIEELPNDEFQLASPVKQVQLLVIHCSFESRFPTGYLPLADVSRQEDMWSIKLHVRWLRHHMCCGFDVCEQ